jgi:thymidylate synthase
MLAELIWYFSGSQSSKWISQFAKLWCKISDDGETSNSAYGYSILYKHGFSQIDQVVEILKNDSNSR